MAKSILQGYLNLFSLVTKTPDEMLEKVELVMISAFNIPRRYDTGIIIAQIRSFEEDLNP